MEKGKEVEAPVFDEKDGFLGWSVSSAPDSEIIKTGRFTVNGDSVFFLRAKYRVSFVERYGADYNVPPSFETVRGFVYTLPEPAENVFVVLKPVFAAWIIGDDVFYQPGDTIVIDSDTLIKALYIQINL